MAVIVGIESTAHTFGIGIVKDGKVIANIKDTYTTKSGGIIPKEAAKHHREIKNRIYFGTLEQAGINEKDIDAVAFSQGPGLAPCLLEGMKFAKELALKLKKPIVPVNHCISHLEIGKITGAKDPVMLYVSGANTQIIAYSANRYRIFGETLDLGVGNFIDTFARIMNIGFPGGPTVQKLASQGKNYIELPYVVKGMDISLSGILTNLKQKFESGKYSKEDLCFTCRKLFLQCLLKQQREHLHIQERRSLCLEEELHAILAYKMCRIMCEERGAKLFVPENALLVDNGAMIAFLGEIMFNKGIKVPYNKIEEIDIKPRQRTDEVEVEWK